jgi:hypothetical protein
MGVCLGRPKWRQPYNLSKIGVEWANRTGVDQNKKQPRDSDGVFNLDSQSDSEVRYPFYSTTVLTTTSSSAVPGTRVQLYHSI